jgi:hypothetical protein
MKRVVFALSIVFALFSGCEETPPFIDFTDPGDQDTGYISDTVPSAQHKMVLIEDITGVRCVNCPAAAVKIKEIITSKSEDSVIALALYPWPNNTNGNWTNTNPYVGFPKLANDTCSQIVESVGVPGGLPSGYVDRYDFPPQSSKPKDVVNWANLVNQRLRVTTPVNINLKKSVNGKKISIDVKLSYTKGVATSHKIALYLAEDSIVSRQKGQNGEMDGYVHNHAVRHTFDLAVGRPLKGSLFRGKTYDKHYEYELPANSPIRLDHCHVVCVVMVAGTDEVVNVRKIELH